LTIIVLWFGSKVWGMSTKTVAITRRMRFRKRQRPAREVTCLRAGPERESWTRVVTEESSPSYEADENEKK